MTPADLARRLPAPEVLARRSIALAALDAALSPDWEGRCFSYDPAWSDDEEMASMSNGSGDAYFIVFGDEGSVLRAFDHESELSPWSRADRSVVPEILDGFPDELRSVIDEPAFGTEDGPAIELTFCAWWVGDGPWQVGPVHDDGGAAALLQVLLDGGTGAFRTFAAERYEVDLDPADVQHLLDLEPIDAARIARLNPDADPFDALDEIDAAGYPVEG